MQVVGVTFSENPKTFYFLPNNLTVNVGDFVVVQPSRGLSLAKVCLVKDAGKDFESENELLPIIRIATEQDKNTHIENEKQAKQITPRIKHIVKNCKLQMKIANVQYLLDKSKIIISYTAEDRVDFRELLKMLASEFKTRIELRQIGSRDEVQQVGAMGICGRICCCKSFLNDFDKVSIKMAKTQGIALNPNKINGACGRLLCCLKYEDDFYNEIISKMPKVASCVKTPDGEAVVQYNDILKQQVTVQFTKGEETERKVYELKDIVFSSIFKKSDDDSQE